MKHCAKKLLGLAFALALCLAVGGTALAETPESADAPAALPEQEMLAYEPYAAPAAGNNVTGNIVTDGYQVTIPTTVTVNSGDNKGTLPVTAQLKQYRTLYIGIASQDDKWTLKYQGAAAGTTTPEVGYELKNKDGGAHTPGGMWHYDEGGHKITYATSAVESFDTAEIPLSVSIPTPSQATMSGTYSDTLTFTFNITKQSVTYTINVYHQEMQLTGNYFSGADVAPNYQALKMVDKVGTDGIPIGSATPDEVYTYEYGFANDLPVGNPSDTWTRPRPASDGGEDERSWEDLTYDLNLQQNYNTGNKDVVVNLNLVRKWCWLDVNGITDKATCADCEKDGNQGGSIASFVNIRVSDGTSWSGWYWYSKGDDYWGTFPYGTEFQLGLHRVKDGYAYDEETGGNVAIYANGLPTCTTGKETSPDGKTHYRVYQGKLEGEPVDTTLHNTTGGGNVHDGAGNKNLPRYCYNPCFVDGITYYANGGDGGREDTNHYHGAHTSFKYTDGMKLADLTDTDTGCAFTAPEGKVFAGWSTTPNYTKGQELYDANTDVSRVTWPTRPTVSNHDTLPTKDGQTVCRTLYAIWGYNITVQFEDKTGYTADGTKDPVFGSPMTGYSFTLKGQAVEEGKGWTLDLTNPVVQEKITAATNEAKDATLIENATDNETATGEELERKIWKIGNYTEGGHTFDYTEECTISAENLKKPNPTLMIQRRRYLLSVISAEATTSYVYGIAKNPNDQKYGTFTVTVNNDEKASNTSFYQCGLNYGAGYEIKDVKAEPDYEDQGYLIFKLSLTEGTAPTTGVVFKYMTQSYSGFMTAKDDKLHYYTPSDQNPEPVYNGDSVRVAFSKKSSSTPGSTTPMPGPSLAPGLSSPAPAAGVTLHYHANFEPDDALEETVKTVYCRSAADVTVHPCMFKRAGYAFAGWNTEEDGTGTWYWVNGVPVTDWRDGNTVDLYAQWKKTAAQRPVVDSDPIDPADPAEPFDPDAPPAELDELFGVDPDAAFDAAPDPLPEELDAAFDADPDPLPEELDDAFGVDPGGDTDAPLPS